MEISQEQLNPYCSQFAWHGALVIDGCLLFRTPKMAGERGLVQSDVGHDDDPRGRYPDAPVPHL